MSCSVNYGLKIVLVAGNYNEHIKASTAMTRVLKLSTLKMFQQQILTEEDKI